MKIICTILLSLFLAPSFAQTDKNDTVYVNDYYRLRALYIKYIDARNTTKTYKLREEFVMKAKFNGDYREFREFKGEDSMIEWVRLNIDKTAFKNVAEADKLWQDLKTSDQVKPQEEITFNEEAKKMSEKHGRQIVMDVRTNSGAGGRDPKEEPDYKVAYQKLKTLTIAQRNSESFRNARAMEKAYTKKANFNRKTDKYTYPETIYDWVVNNLSRTGFTSLTEAKLEWYKVEDAQEAERKANAEYHDFRSECLSKYGPYMGTDIMFEVMAEN